VGAALRRARRHAGWLAVALWTFVLHNAVDFPLYDPQVNILWWILLGLVIRPPHGVRHQSGDWASSELGV